MKTVKRKAEVGERILVVDEVTEIEGLDKSIFVISDRKCSPGFVITEDGYIFRNSEYEVIEDTAGDITGNAILTEIMDKFSGQTEKGVRKYGKTVDPDDYSTIEWIDHAIEESIDHIVYLTTLKQKLRGQRHE